MTTKLKIILGFVVMVLLLGTVVVMSYFYLEKSTTGFGDYRRTARLNVVTSDMVATVYRSLSRTFLYADSGDSTLIDKGIEDIDAIMQMAKDAEAVAVRDEVKTTLREIAAAAAPMKKNFSDLRSAVIDMHEQYNGKVRPGYENMRECFIKLGDMSYNANNIEAFNEIEHIWPGFSSCLSSLARFSESSDEKEGASAKDRVDKMLPQLEELGNSLVTPAARAVHKDLMASYNSLKDALDVMILRAATIRGIKAEILAAQTKLTTISAGLSKKFDDEQGVLGPALVASNELAQKMGMIIGVAGVLVGIALAMFIIISLVRVLNNLIHYAREVANGNFEAKVSIREGGEIGNTVNAIQTIPAVLNEVLGEYRALEVGIAQGQLAATGPEAKFKGGFATLMRGTNAILNSFLTVIENIPSPVVMLDKDQKAAYVNRVGRGLAGEAYKGKTCFELFAREDFGKDGDALRKAVDTKAPAQSETRAHPQGKEIFITYTVIPMLDAKGAMNSILQLITDVTALKQQQNTMLNVAAQASEISNRVAAASEELAAQVEQVSRGAEMQRARVESTASAMTEMNATVLEVARSASEASEQSEVTRGKADAGSALVNKVVHSMDQVNKVAVNLQNNMKELGSQAENIGGVMNVISDIADQTNLLALNAAIEAARAGEAGRGFAVVADEVRKLAEKTMSATNEVGSSIAAVQASAKHNIEEVDRAVTNINEATELANQSGDSLTEIVNLASANSAIVASIATAAEEQSATSEEINSAIEEINHIVGETSDGMTQSSQAVQELSQMAQELKQVMSHLQK